LRRQPHSALARWFHERVGDNGILVVNQPESAFADVEWELDQWPATTDSDMTVASLPALTAVQRVSFDGSSSTTSKSVVKVRRR
jgi:hypothetical protein